MKRKLPRYELCFSALQRAENSSMGRAGDTLRRTNRFQCSSASRKFLNEEDLILQTFVKLCFSALQRAENSSMARWIAVQLVTFRFSALQRAENSSMFGLVLGTKRQVQGFSALQRAENSSMVVDDRQPVPEKRRFSALQRAENSSMYLKSARCRHSCTVSVLFSEPKIPQ